mgnify:CR=1 FL=1
MSADELIQETFSDAERYRWLRRYDHLSAVNSLLEDPGFYTLDQAVDHLMRLDPRPYTPKDKE